jgi:predicted amidohydrolase
VPRGDSGLDGDHEAGELSWSMVGTMSKVLALGVPLFDVVRMATVGPARAMRLEATKGALAVGRAAEISILEVRTGDFALVDSEGARRAARELILPRRTIIGRRSWRCAPATMPELANEYGRPNPGLVLPGPSA